MSKYRKLTHVYYKCEYHIVFTPKYRFRIPEGMVKSLVEHDLQVISSWKDVLVREANVQKDHVHLVCSIPPKLSVSDYTGLLKCKMAIKLFKTYPGPETKALLGQPFLVKGIFCEYGGPGRGDDKAVREISGTPLMVQGSLWPFGPNLKIKASVFNGGFLLCTIEVLDISSYSTAR